MLGRLRTAKHSHLQCLIACLEDVWHLQAHKALQDTCSKPLSLAQCYAAASAAATPVSRSLEAGSPLLKAVSSLNQQGHGTQVHADHRRDYSDLLRHTPRTGDRKHAHRQQAVKVVSSSRPGEQEDAVTAQESRASSSEVSGLDRRVQSTPTLLCSSDPRAGGQGCEPPRAHHHAQH